ncbi:hypothetical protein LIER_11591 [Lithospermum erythrorhizon]|uniref:Uncharacterized protein n=1 Tax=Lithospermum erythrorhizon TaxID=34254 RepID=A0AAV3PP25_LITER
MKLKKFLSKMDDRNRVDMSSFLLFEATGDNSEFLASSKNTNFPKFISEDDSDAMSCSYDEYEVVHNIDDEVCVGILDNRDSRIHGKDDNNFYYVECKREHEDEDEDEEEGVVDQDLKKGGDHKMWKPNKVDETPSITNVVCVESCVELMRQREQDKLFWKSCLES